MEAALTRLVWRRAEGHCEYCQLPQEFDDRAFEIDHVISQKHDGPTVASNLALSCFRCNSFKGSDISGINTATRRIVGLFNPRRHQWTKHFQWDGAKLIGLTPTGRVTIEVLQINDPFRLELREELIEEGVFPPG
jgi:hypothetical protein